MRRVLSAAIGVAALACLALVGPGSTQGQNADQAWGSLSGRVVLDGNNVPKTESLVPKMQIHADKACCLMGKEIEKVDLTWVIDPKTMGVGNVLIYLKPKGGSFPIHEQDKKRAGQVVMDQPHCQFLPRSLAHYPAYFDGQKLVPTGETFVAKNSAIVPHNIRGTGNPKYDNAGFNFNLPPGAAKPLTLNPQPLPIIMNCDIHPWMRSNVGVYNHPYFAVTKDDGTFTIPRVPAGIEVGLAGWHEAVGYIAGKDGVAVTFKAGANTAPELKIQAPKKE